MYRYDFDYASILIYIIMIVNFFHTRHIKNGINTIFKFMLFTALITPISDIIRMYTIGNQMSWTSVELWNSIYFISQQLVSLQMFAYVFGQAKMHEATRQIVRIAITAPVYMAIAFIITNPLHGLIFTYENGTYEFHQTGTIMYLTLLIYFIAALIYCYRYSKQISQTFKVLVYVIFFINLLGRDLQNKHQDILIHSFIVSICVLIIFLYTQKDQNFFDSWTGLMTKVYFQKRTVRLIYNRVPFDMVLIRVADYDLLTATYGVINVEMMVADIAKYIQSFVPRGDAYIISNSCMALMVPHIGKVPDVEKMKKDIYEGLEKVWMVNGIEIVCSSFVSSVNYPENCEDERGMRAYAMYFQKMHRMRYGIVPVEELGLKDKAREQQVIAAVERAINNRSFEIYYQPICTTEDKLYVTAEALVRLEDESLGFISPMEFIPLAESNGSIVAIGNIILEKVCQFISTHDLQNMGLEYIEVNLSTIQCLQRNFLERIDEIISKYHVNPSQICFEITETASNCAPTIFTQNLAVLREKGYKLALDDFGSGYANLQRMITTDFDVIKFDKEMIQMTCESEKFHDVFEKLLRMFHSLNFQIVAEGVETYDQYEFLHRSGCDFIQGYYFSRPIPEEEFVKFILHHHKSQ